MESSKPIPGPAKGLANILKRGAAGIQAELIGAAPIHRQFLAGAAPTQLEENEQFENTIMKAEGAQRAKTYQQETLERGDDVLDLDRKRSGTIIRVLRAAEDGQRRFEVVDSRGNAWKQRENKLRKR